MTACLASLVWAESPATNGVTGLKIKPVKGWSLLILGVIPGTPAEVVGLRKGDKIIGVSGQSLAKLRNLKTAVSLIRGAPGDKLQLTIKRGAHEPFDIIFKRGTPAVKTSTASGK